MAGPPALPPDRRIDRNKIEEYLLHPVKGRGKAAFFQSWGFASTRWEELRTALLDHAAAGQLVQVLVSIYGTRYIVRGGLRTPDGRTPPPTLRSVGQADHDAVGIRLITAYPD